MTSSPEKIIMVTMVSVVSRAPTECMLQEAEKSGTMAALDRLVQQMLSRKMKKQTALARRPVTETGM